MGEVALHKLHLDKGLSRSVSVRIMLNLVFMIFNAVPSLDHFNGSFSRQEVVHWGKELFGFKKKCSDFKTVANT